jgi:hypothetical protein
VHVCAFYRWGSTLSTKLFVARKFVVKHIRSKQEEKMQAEKERVSVAFVYVKLFVPCKFVVEHIRSKQAEGKGLCRACVFKAVRGPHVWFKTCAASRMTLVLTHNLHTIKVTTIL